ncbi:putative ankyrin repeat protein [Diplodia seriata]|uniref:Putative ankyrin repeat protein n=1 Tax=Diplodia seriata TaxID=420778 RepID=A0A1S8BD73_9PEZI|nr:putative ankyrin repeat protein [Diplodia seriata]
MSSPSPPPPPPPTQDQILSALATSPLPHILALLSACPSPPPASALASAAIAHDRGDMITHLLTTNGVPVHAIPRKQAVAAQSRSVLQALLDSGGWDINEDLGSYRGSALASAVLARAPPDFVAWLLERGADPNGPCAGVDHCGHALRVAVQMADGEGEGLSPVARMLLERGADVDGSRALHMAAQKGWVGWVRALVEEWGAGVDAEGIDPDWAGSTEREMGIGAPLHYAARNGHGEVARYLVGRGADLGRRDSNGRTPREVAEHFGHDEVARVLALEG